MSQDQKNADLGHPPERPIWMAFRVGSFLWSIPLAARTAGRRFPWCWTFRCGARVMWRIARFVAIPLRLSMRWKTRPWWSLALGAWNKQSAFYWPRRGAEVDSLYPPAAEMKIRFGENGLLRDTRSSRLPDATRGMLVCPVRVCYKFGLVFRVDDSCLLLIFLLVKLTASWCITDPGWAGRPPTCNGSMITPGRIRRVRWSRLPRRQIAPCSSTFCRWIWAPCAGSRRVSTYIQFPDRFF